MKNILLITIFLYCNFSISQEKIFESSSSMKSKTSFETVMIKRNITISDKQIIITKYRNGSIEDLVLNIDNTGAKFDDFDGTEVWYYCTSNNKDELFDTFYKYIVIEKNLMLGKK